jgi:valyl-tRNA synthetase
LRVSLEGVIDPAQEIEKMTKEVARLEQERERLGKLLADESFTAKAPKTAIEAQKNKLVELAEKKKNLLEQIKDLS